MGALTDAFIKMLKGMSPPGNLSQKEWKKLVAEVEAKNKNAN